MGTLRIYLYNTVHNRMHVSEPKGGNDMQTVDCTECSRRLSSAEKRRPGADQITSRRDNSGLNLLALDRVGVEPPVDRRMASRLFPLADPSALGWTAVMCNTQRMCPSDVTDRQAPRERETTVHVRSETSSAWGHVDRATMTQLYRALYCS